MRRGCIKSTHVYKGCLFCQGQPPHQMFPHKNTDRREKPWNVEETFSNLCKDAVLLDFLSKSPQGVWASPPRSARAGEVGQHVRSPAWGGRHRTCVKPFDFPPTPNMSLELLTTGGGQGAVLIRRPLSAQRKEASMKGDARGDEGEFGEMNVSKTDAGVPSMSRHWKRPVISPGDGFRIQFSSCKLSGYVWVRTSLHVFLCAEGKAHGRLLSF